jgi:GntR family transcriptional regulator
MQTPRPLFAKDIPLHHQIYELLRVKIMDGLYVGRGDFPGEAELARRFDVSVATSRAVLQRLASEGLIERGRGRRPEAVFIPHEEAVTPLIANIGLFTYKLLGIAEVIAPWAACRSFGLPAGSVFWRCLRLRMVEGRPHSVAFSYQPLKIGRLHAADACRGESIPRMLEALGYPVSRVDSVVGVRRPPVEVSAALDVIVWDKLLQTTVISFSRGDEPVDFSRIYFHPDLQHSVGAVTYDLGQFPRPVIGGLL